MLGIVIGGNQSDSRLFQETWWRSVVMVGWMGFSRFVILSYYAVIAGWTLAYMFKSFVVLWLLQEKGKRRCFGAFVSDPVQSISYHVAVMAITSGIVYKGISGGIEKLRILMPALFVILLVLIVRSVTLQGRVQG